MRTPQRTRYCQLVALAMTLLFSTLNATDLQANELQWRQDPDTGLMVAQLTASTPDNIDYYALYYHQESLSGDGRYLIYRSIQGDGTHAINASRSYWRLDLETGARAELMPVGLALDAFVHGNQVFLYHREEIGAFFNRISVVNLETLETTELANVGNTDLAGAIAVNADATMLIYQTHDDRVELLDLSDQDVPSHVQVLMGSPGIYQHFQFSPVDPELFTFIFQRQEDPYGLKRVHIGRAERAPDQSITVSHQQMTPATRGEPVDSYQLPHPFFGIDGQLWSDAIHSLDSHPNAYVPFQVDTDPAGRFGQLSPSPLVVMQDEEWQLHLSTSRALDWFAGDGTHIPGSLGEEFIHLLRIEAVGCTPLFTSSPCGSVEQIQLSSSLGANLQLGGNWEANSKTLRTLDGVVFSAPWDFVSNQSTPVIVTTPDVNRARNLFLIKLPNRLKARLDAARVDDAVTGPWKAGHRVTVDTDGVWRVDYGSAEGFGDGVVDDTVNGAVGDGYTLADLNGDDVEDRVTFIDGGPGAWVTQVSYSSYDGRLGTNIDAVRFESSAPDWTALDDLDGNGLDDLVRVTQHSHGILWEGFLNHNATLPSSTNPSTGYQAASFGNPVGTEHAFVADVNGDGYADRIVVERFWDIWQWKVDYSLPNSFGDGVVDTEQLAYGYPALDRPLVDDVDGDGLADLVMVRGLGTPLWIAALSDDTGFGASQTVFGTYGFGDVNDHQAIGHFVHFPVASPAP